MRELFTSILGAVASNKVHDPRSNWPFAWPPPPIRHNIRKIFQYPPRRLAAARFRLPGSTNTVALTFDDGPNPVYTPRILDALGDLGIPATFFLVGRAAQVHPYLVQRIIKEGHQVGSHSYSHVHPRKISAVKLAQDYKTGKAAVEDVCGRGITLFRPPHGYLDLLSAATLRTMGADTWLWTDDPEDWRPNISCEEIVGGLDSLAARSVVLLHDGLEEPLDVSALDRSATLQALPKIFLTARHKGLGFSVLPED